MSVLGLVYFETPFYIYSNQSLREDDFIGSNLAYKLAILDWDYNFMVGMVGNDCVWSGWFIGCYINNRHKYSTLRNPGTNTSYIKIKISSKYD